MSGMLHPWQKNAWQQLQEMRQRLPHAILVHGPEGIGKTDFAERFAQSLLCQSPLAGDHPCDKCDACGWVQQYSHPDFRRVRPEALDEEESATDEADEGDNKKKSAKAPSKEIKIAQIRALADFVNISTHRQGLRIVLLYPADALNAMAANSLLKTLEEPPPSTLFLLISNAADRLLPTIISRCRKFAMGMPATPEALDWLREQGVSDADHWLAEQGGAPLLALVYAQNGQRELLDEFLQELCRPAADTALKSAERLQKASVSELVTWLQRWAYDLFSFKMAGEIRYYPRYGKQISSLSTRADPGALRSLLLSLNQRKAVSDHPLSAKLFLEDMLLEYAGVFPA